MCLVKKHYLFILLNWIEKLRGGNVKMKNVIKYTRNIISKNIDYFYDEVMNVIESLLVETYRYHDIVINKSDYEKLFQERFKMGWDLDSLIFLCDDQMYERFIKIISYKGKLEEEKIFMFFDKLSSKINSKKDIIDIFTNNISNHNQFESFTIKIQKRIMEIYRILKYKPKRDTKICVELFKIFCNDTIMFYNNFFINLFRLIDIG